MLPNSTSVPVAGWHRRLLTVAAVFIILLIAAGGVLCVTQSIRSCPDWPGCFGRLLPPLEASPILEITHRFLAASSGLLILTAAVTGVVRARRSGWILIPPLLAMALLIEVSYFGARVVLEGLSPGWAAVDVGSALLAAALIIVSAMMARQEPGARLDFNTPLARLALGGTILVFLVLVSNVLSVGKNPLASCLGWPLFSLTPFRLAWMGISAAAVAFVILLTVQAWRRRRQNRALFGLAGGVLALFLLEALLQAALLVFGQKVGLLVPYTITMAFLWGTLVALGTQAALE